MYKKTRLKVVRRRSLLRSQHSVALVGRPDFVCVTSTLVYGSNTSGVGLTVGTSPVSFDVAGVVCVVTGVVCLITGIWQLEVTGTSLTLPVLSACHLCMIVALPGPCWCIRSLS